MGGWVDVAAVWMFWRGQKYLATAGIRNRDRPTRFLVNIPTELSRHHKLSSVLNLSSLHRKFYWGLIFSFYHKSQTIQIWSYNILKNEDTTYLATYIL